MIEFGQLTGEIYKNSYEVKLRTGESLFAPLCVMGVNTPQPSSAWILSNRKKFLALLTYEKDILSNPMIIGFYPVKGADSSSYDLFERLLELVKTLVEDLLSAKVSTQIGPQQFLPDTLLKLEQIKLSLEKIDNDITKLRL